MTISFNDVPANSRVPFLFVEFDASRAGSGEQAFRSLLFGQRLSTGAVAAGVPTQIVTAADAASAFGAGSMLHHMAEAYRRTDPLGELWVVALDDDGGGAAEIQTITVGGTATAGGTLALYVNGRRVAVTVSTGDAATAVAAAIKTAMDALGTKLSATAAVADAVVTVTARHKGLAPELDIRTNYRPDDRLPAGITATIATTGGATVRGAGDPGIPSAIAAIGDEQYNVIATPYTGPDDIAALESELASRWGPFHQNDGAAFGAYRGLAGTVAQGTTYGNARNSPHSTIMDCGKTPTPQYEWAAAVAGAVAAKGSIDPARPFQTIVLPGILPPEVKDRRTFAEQDVLLSDGISTYDVDQAGVVSIQRLITTSQTINGVPNAAYLDVNTPMTLSFLRANFRNRIRRKFPRHKLANDGTRIGPGQAVITPGIGRAEAIAWGREMEERGLIEDFDQFENDLICERNADDPNRLDWLMSPNLINQFRAGAAQIAFIS